MNDENFILIKGFMVNRLNLKGIKLIIYAIIYGFSQDGESDFAGGISYLQSWTGASYKTVCTALKELTEDGLIAKLTVAGEANRYKAVIDAEPQTVQAAPVVAEPQKNDPKTSFDIATVINYLNDKTGGKYRAGAKDAREHLTARFKEGYTVADACRVIDNMTATWKGTDFERYLRPSTLFGNKFASYLIRTAPEKPQASYDLDAYKARAVNQVIKYERKPKNEN